MTFKVVKYIFALVLALQFCPQGFAQNTIFAKFDTLSCRGANDLEFPGFSAVFSISFGATETATATLVGRPMFEDIKLVKTLDDCTPLLFKNLAQGPRLASVTIHMVTPGTGTAPPTRILDILLEQVLVTGDEFAEAAGGRPSEVVSLSWTKITITHVPTGNKFTWNRVTNAPF